jgi:hypothetical protein
MSYVSFDAHAQEKSKLLFDRARCTFWIILLVTKAGGSNTACFDYASLGAELLRILKGISFCQGYRLSFL